MGLIQDVIKNWKNKQEEMEEQDDDVTKDRYLRSLRRERRIQLEEIEKKQLKKAIADYKKEKMRALWSNSENLENKHSIIKGKIEKKKDLLREKQKLIGKSSIFNNGKDEFKKTKKTSFFK